MQDSPKISVLLSVYNCEKYIKEAVESILNQTFKDFEFIIINDGSTDGSGEILREFKDTDARIVLVEQKNIGFAASLNRGLSLCKAQIVARMDADDISLPQRLERQFEYMEAHPDVTVLGSQALLINEKSERIGEWILPSSNEDVADALLIANALIHPTVMFRKEAINYAGGYSDYIAAVDYDLWLRLLEKGFLFVNLPEVLLYYRRSVAARMSQRHSGEQALTALKIQKRTILNMIAANKIKREDIQRLISFFPERDPLTNRAETLDVSFEEFSLYKLWGNYDTDSLEMTKQAYLKTKDPKYIRILAEKEKIGGRLKIAGLYQMWADCLSGDDAYNYLKTEESSIIHSSGKDNERAVISVFLPFDGDQDDFSERFYSLVNQKKMPLKIVVICDEREPAIEKELIPKNFQLNIISDRNCGAAWQRVLSEEDGFIKVYLLPQCRFHPDFLENVKEKFQDQSCKIVYASPEIRYRDVFYEGNNLTAYYEGEKNREQLLQGELYLCGFCHVNTLNSSLMFVLDELGGDYDTAIAMNIAYRFEFDSFPVRNICLIDSPKIKNRIGEVFRKKLLKWYYEILLSRIPEAEKALHEKDFKKLTKVLNQIDELYENGYFFSKEARSRILKLFLNGTKKPLKYKLFQKEFEYWPKQIIKKAFSQKKYILSLHLLFKVFYLKMRMIQ